MDIRLTNVISMIHFVITTFLLFITLIVFSLFIALQYGVQLKAFSVGGLKFDALYIKCDNGLILSAKSLSIIKGNTKTTTSSAFNFEQLPQRYERLRSYLTLFKRIDIDAFQTQKYRGSVHYADNTAVVQLRSERFDANARIISRSDKLLFENVTLNAIGDPLTLHARTLYLPQSNDSYTHLSLHVAQRNSFESYVQTHNSRVRFNTRADAPVSTLRELVGFLRLHKATAPWIVDYAKGDAPLLQALHGDFDLNAPDTILRSIVAKARWEDVDYTFARGFEPAHAKQADLLFKEGKLFIVPIEGRFYDQYGGNTDLYIDFNPKDPILSLHLDTNATLDGDMLSLLGHYHIHLPIRQYGGRTQTDLTLNVNLRNEHTSALGRFTLQDANLTLYNEPIMAKSGVIELENAMVTLRDINASYQHYAKGLLNGRIDAQNDEGRLDIELTSAKLLDHPKVSLNQKRLHVNYRFSKHRSDILSVAPSSWRVGEKHYLKVDAFKTPFEYHTLSGYLPKTRLWFDHNSSADVNGTINFRDNLANLDFKLEGFNLASLKQQDKHLHVHAQYDSNLTLSTPKSSSWEVAGLPLKASPLALSFKDEALHVNDARFKLDNRIEGNVTGDYAWSDRNGTFMLSMLDISTSKFGKMFSHPQPLALHVSHDEGITELSASKLHFGLKLMRQGWKMDLQSFEALAPYSTLMRDYNVTSGYMTLSSTPVQSGIVFSGLLNFPYGILVANNQPQYRYHFAGEYDEGRASVYVNDTLHVEYFDKIDITCSNIGFNLIALSDFLKSRPEHNDTTIMPPLSLVAGESYLYFTPTRKALADSLTYSCDNNETFASLIHGKGGAGLEMRDGLFYLYGQHFGDTFMNALFSLSEHKGGQFSLALKGTPERFHGVTKVEKTRITDYVLFNNLLAFINTIPSLASFSFPSYEQKGLKISEAYAAFDYYDDMMHFSDIKFDTKEFDLYGKGEADFINNHVDMKLNLKTDLGKNVSNLPVVGYILVGDDGTAATSFHISGNLDDPKVENALAEDIIIAPFNMLFRAVTYPFHVLKSLGEEQNTTVKPDPTRF